MTIAEDIREEFLETANDEGFGEDVVYVINGVEKHIRAIIYRNGLNSHTMRHDRGSESKPSRYNFEIRISNDETYGIPEIKTKEHTVKVKKNLFDSSYHTMQVIEITEQDPGTYKLGLSV
ncbi:MAG: hypothetical protein WC998_02900 [Candidatus Paceibacterota bacterium]|jgi:hypothetical protein